MNELTFQPVSQKTSDAIGGKIWQARCGIFEYTIVSHPMIGGFDISICCIAPYLPAGPFKTYEEAVSACNAAVNTLSG